MPKVSIVVGLTILFVAFKLCGVIDWSWVLIMCPVWLWILFLFFVYLYVIYLIFQDTKKLRKN